MIGVGKMLMAKVTILVWSHKSHHNTSRVGKTIGPKLVDLGEMRTAKIMTVSCTCGGRLLELGRMLEFFLIQMEIKS